MSTIQQLSKNEFQSIISKSKCYADILRTLGLRVEGGFYNTIKRRIKRENIDVSHFLSVKELMSNKLNFNWINKEDFINKLENGLISNTDTIKRKIREFDLISYECSECKVKNEWNNKPLVLQLDHIDGNHKNNHFKNLRWLCPNCHSQTETFCGKHKKIKQNFCVSCGTKISIKSKMCNKCSCVDKGIKLRKVKNRPTKEELESLIVFFPMTQLGKKYGVSDNAIRKWCKSYNIEIGRKDRLCSDDPSL